MHLYFCEKAQKLFCSNGDAVQQNKMQFTCKEAQNLKDVQK